MNILWPAYLLFILILLWEIPDMQRRVKCIARTFYWVGFRCVGLQTWLIVRDLTEGIAKLTMLILFFGVMLADDLRGRFETGDLRAEQLERCWQRIEAFFMMGEACQEELEA